MTNISLGYQKSLLVTEIQLCLSVININGLNDRNFFRLSITIIDGPNFISLTDTDGEKFSWLLLIKY